MGLPFRAAAGVLAAILALLAGSHAAVAASYPNPGRVTGDITAVHDPALIGTADGTYLL